MTMTTAQCISGSLVSMEKDMKAPSKFRKIAERIHGRRNVYPVNGVHPPVHYTAFNEASGKWAMRIIFTAINDSGVSCRVIAPNDEYMSSTVQV